METHHVMIVEDELLTCSAYETIFARIKEEKSNYGFHLNICNTYGEGEKAIDWYTEKKIVPLALLDIRLSNNNGIKDNGSGEDLGKRLKSLNPRSRVIFITSISDRYRYYTIFRKINPEGFLFKSEIGFDQVKEAIEKVLEGQTYFSRSINSFLRNEIRIDRSFDETDRELLYYFSKRLKIKDISERINLSVQGIEWRQRKLARAFDLENGKISGLVQKARENGLI